MIRTILELSSRNSSRRIAREIIRQQKPSRLPFRKEFSSAPSKNVSAKPGSTGKPEESGSSLPKVLIGSVAVGAAIMAAYQTGYLDQVLNKEKHDSLKAVEVGNNKENQTPLYQESNSLPNIVEDKIPTTSEVPEELSLNKEQEREKTDNQTAFPSSDPSTERQDEILSQEQDKSHVTAEEDKVLDQEKLLAGSLAPPDQSADSGISAEGSPPEEIPEASTSMHPKEEVEVPQISTPSDPIKVDSEPIKGDSEVQSLSPDPHQHLPIEGKNEEPHSTAIDTPPLLDAYHLRDKENGIPSVSVDNHGEGEAFASGIKELGDAEVVSKDGKLILDFLQAIHAAELRQSELDARTYAEEKRALKEKYEKELKDAIARELMNAEEAALLDKELKRERAKAAAAVKSLQQKLEEKHKIELEEKEREAELKLEKVEELAKAEMSAAIAREKAAQIEKMNEANLHINALCMAFYARSEEARRTHSVHKLALGALALEDALSKGLPIKAEIEALQTYLQGIEKDSVLDVVLSSLPEETISHGTESVLQLNQQFDSIKGTLRHFSLIPPGGGGVLAHSLAYIASLLKVQNVDPSGEGIESVIGRVENYLAEGKLAEAADALEEGVKGSQAADIIHTWVKQTRNRAIAEQALTMLQSYATSVSLT